MRPRPFQAVPSPVSATNTTIFILSVMQLSVITHVPASAPEKKSIQRRSSLQKIKAINDRVFSAHRLLLVVWLVVGLVPLGLQARSYAKFLKPHKIPQSLVVPSGTQKEMENTTALCPAKGFILAGIWWNLEATHYYKTNHGIVCHSVIPQYNIHGNYWIGNSTTTPHRGTPPACANDSLAYNLYMYHGSIGFYSFYDEIDGTYCAKDNTGYVMANVLGTHDINGVFLADDMGSVESRMSYWYGIAGGLWLLYRGLTIRRSYLVCRCYGRKCDEMGVGINHKEAMVFVQESLRLSAHGFARGSILANENAVLSKLKCVRSTEYPLDLYRLHCTRCARRWTLDACVW
ncbi:hypothetical protein ON010_g2906 [Phytophthora cinnamomi]|nr:hypothetical protein ON010_g2906 [Phytophthora cinnamomi]